MASAVSDLLVAHTSTASIATLVLLLLATATVYLFKGPSLPKNAPPYATESYPIIGSLAFFTQRWTWFHRQSTRSSTKNFSFHVGDKPVVAIASEEGRRVFFESKTLGFGEGYAGLLAGSPEVKLPPGEGFSAYFSKRLTTLLKGNILAKGLPNLLNDVRTRFEEMGENPKGMTDPFDSFYRIVYQLTMRTVACNEIAEDRAMLDKTLEIFERVEKAATPWMIMYSWLPLPSRLKRTYAGGQLYMIFKKIVDDRKKTGRREDDALQYLMDLGDDVAKIIQFVLGALFAGQLNSGVNAAWVATYLVNDQYWLQRVREEVNSVADRYAPDASLPLKDRLSQIPLDAWESEFPIIDICLKDSIRLQTLGTAFRKNITDHDIPLDKEGKEVIPAGAYAAFGVGSIHYDPEIYTNPDEWDPSRYLPDRAEDKKRTYGWIGWGVSRHPCLGMRFAKLENNIITAFFVSMFDDLKLVDAKGNPTGIPPTNRDGLTATKPDGLAFIQYKVRS